MGRGDVPWTVLADPEGNEFCVLEPREIYRDTGPIAAVVADCEDPRAMARFWGEAMDWTLLLAGGRRTGRVVSGRRSGHRRQAGSRR